MKRYLSWAFALGTIALASPALAETALSAEAGAAAASGKAWYFVAIIITSGFSMAIAAAVCALGQGKAITAALESMARQPSLAGQLQTGMIIGLALIESLAIYVLLISLILLFLKFDTSTLGF